MAADILIVRSNVVPVGKDQVQHLEMTADIAGKFNRAFDKDVFPIPTYRLDKESKVPGTDGQKMSKSYGNTIDIFAEGKPLEKTVMAIKTDSTPMGQPLNPDNCNVFACTACSPRRPEGQMAQRLQNASASIARAQEDRRVRPFRAGAELAAQPDTVEDILRGERHSKRANRDAKTMEKVYKATGLL